MASEVLWNLFLNKSFITEKKCRFVLVWLKEKKQYGSNAFFNVITVKIMALNGNGQKQNYNILFVKINIDIIRKIFNYCYNCTWFI